MAETLLVTVLFIIPGYIAASVRRYKSFMPPPTEKAVESVVWSLVVYLTLGLLPSLNMAGFVQAVSSVTALLSSPQLLGSYCGVLAYSALCGCALHWFLSLDKVTRFLGQTPYEIVWDEFWKKNGHKDRLVVVLLTKSTGWAGKVVTASGPRTDRELWLTSVMWYENGDFTPVNCEHIVVGCKDAMAVMMLPEDLA